MFDAPPPSFGANGSQAVQRGLNQLCLDCIAVAVTGLATQAMLRRLGSNRKVNFIDRVRDRWRAVDLHKLARHCIRIFSKALCECRFVRQRDVKRHAVVHQAPKDLHAATHDKRGFNLQLSKIYVTAVDGSAHTPSQAFPPGGQAKC